MCSRFQVFAADFALYNIVFFFIASQIYRKIRTLECNNYKINNLICSVEIVNRRGGYIKRHQFKCKLLSRQSLPRELNLSSLENKNRKGRSTLSLFCANRLRPVTHSLRDIYATQPCILGIEYRYKKLNMQVYKAIISSRCLPPRHAFQ